MYMYTDQHVHFTLYIILGHKAKEIVDKTMDGCMTLVLTIVKWNQNKGVNETIVLKSVE